MSNSTVIKPLCIGCNHTPEQIEEYIEAAKDDEVTPDEFVKANEGTYNRSNGHFLCTDCYIAAGCPSSPTGWIAP